MAKKKKVRVQLQKNRFKPRREGDWTRQYRENDEKAEQAAHGERVRAKGGVSRKRTIQVDGESNEIAIAESDCLRGRVLLVQGLYCTVVTDDGQIYRCYTRRLLKSLEIDARSVLTTGDWAWFRPAPDNEGFIVRVEPRMRVLARRYRKRDQIIAANVEQALIVGSLVEPDLKPNLIDRYLVTAEASGIRPIICLNKVDRANGVGAIPLAGLYSQLGYAIVLTSATEKRGIDRLRDELRGKETVIVGQSGVGKSSLLNALEPTYHLKVGDVCAWTQKGRHTTTTAQLLKMEGGGALVDTPGIRQFDLWSVEASAVSRHFIEFRPFMPYCRFPGCSHTHEEECAVKDAVDDGYINAGRYDSYVRILGAPASAEEEA